jgi:transcriptional regulator with XRE-family HTH domain
MAWTNVDRAVRFLRRRRRWRQADLGRAAGLSREAVSRLERGEFQGMTLASIDAIAGALGASIQLTVRWHGEQLDRLLDAAHASIQETVSRRLSGAGWQVRAEVSFNHYGDRGRVDILAFHEASRAVAVLEIKVGIGDVQETLGRLDVKARLGPVLAREVGWPAPATVVAGLVIADDRTSRRVVARHEALFRRFSLRGRDALAWVKQPSSQAPSGLLWYQPLSDSHGATAKRSVRVRPRSDAHRA